MTDQYNPPTFLKNGHANTIYTHFMRKIEPIVYSREKIVPDHGFSLFLDWSKGNNSKLVVLVHGLESSSHAKYIQSLGKHFNERETDVLAINARGCAKNEIHEERAVYHSGQTEDLRIIINHVLKTTDYDELFLVGFSMGGNIVLKYSGEESQNISSKISKVAVLSTPLDLLSSSHALLNKSCYFYTRDFLTTIRKKINSQKEIVKELGFDPIKLINCKNLREFDHAFTAPFFGFDSADDYYIKSSSLPKLGAIKIPALVINAKDDPFLGDTCYPLMSEIKNPLIKYIYSDYGGHVGFYSKNLENLLWSEAKILDFCLKES